MRFQRIALTCLGLLACFGSLSAIGKEKPIRALLVAGGCCHEYTKQKKLLTEGISARANVVWSVVHEGDGTTDHRMSIYNDPDWAKNYDVIVHDECFSDVKDAEFVRNILKPHREGLPAVNLHCAMHSYRVSFDDFKEWFEFTGIDSRAHGPHEPINLFYEAKKHPITEGLTNWSTGNEELYNALEVWKGVTPLLHGQQGSASNVVAWVNDYRGTRVFSTTVGHNSATVGDARYLDLVTRGLLWSVNKLNPTYLKPAAKRKTAAKMVKVPINLALNKKASAPKTEGGRTPEMAVDGDFETRWCAPDGGNNHTWQVDLGKPEDIVGARIAWERDGGKYHYIIAGSEDGVTWKTLVEENEEPRPGLDEQKFSATGIRFVKLTITQAGDWGWASFFEFEVLGKELVEKAASLFDSRLGGVHSPAGFDQTYFAGPPDVSYPTCLEATPWGDVFVGVDLNGSLDREENRGWVVRCRDADGDGTADDFVTFARMDSPRGLVFDNQTLYVMHPPFLSAWHDDNGDGVADRSEVLVSGLGKDLTFRGADHTCNGVRLGIDGFLYIALGDYGARKAVGKDGKEIQVQGGGIVRVRPDGTDLEVVVVGTRNTYDLAIDPFMNLFTCDNTNDGDEWNLRLSHMIATGHYGYPSLYKQFSREIMPTMADYGGGSPTGAIFLDEPDFSEDFGWGLYTCQWGWNNVTRHPLQPSGATFKPGKETFVRVPRPTGIATDGLGNLFIASWKGAGFNYGNPNEGFVARVAPMEHQTKPFPILKDVTDDKLVELLASPSGVRRLHVQREILRRKPTPGLISKIASLANSEHPLQVRAAAVFTLGQISTPEAGAPLLKLTKGSPLREFALRALADSKVASKTRVMVFAEALDDPEPRVRLQGIIALNRLGRTETAERVLPFVTDSDPAVAHAAFRAMVSFKSPEPCFSALEKAGPDEAAAALRVLGNLHDARVVEGLIARLESSGDLKMPILETLCRLYHKEDAWDGSWWSTRPDSTGPYFKPVTWEGTDAIIAVLEKELQNDAKGGRELFSLFGKYKIERPAVPVAALQSLACNAKEDATLRRKAFQNLVKVSETGALQAIAKCSPQDKLGQEFAGEYIRDLQRSKNLQTFIATARAGENAEAELSWGVLLAVARNTNAAAESVSIAKAALPQTVEPESLQRARARFFPNEQSNPTTAAAGNAIANVPYEEALKQVNASVGDPKLGATLFQTTGCALCHTVQKDQPATGPFLGDIAARYSREEILESILKPSARIAQGFETTTIENTKGETFDGFVVRESGDEVEIRNLSGTTVLPKTTIASRGTRPVSVMPEGLADQLSPQQLASLVQYLQSLRLK